MLADITATTLFTHGAYSGVYANASATTIFTLGALTTVFADTTAATILTHAAFTPVLTLHSLALMLTGDAPLASVAVPIDIELIDGAATLAGPTSEELFSISIVSCHSEYLGVIRVDYITTTSFL